MFGRSCAETRDEIPLKKRRNRSWGKRSFCRDSRGQAHFSAMTFRTKHANTRRKMSQTPACERLPVAEVWKQVRTVVAEFVMMRTEP